MNGEVREGTWYFMRVKDISNIGLEHFGYRQGNEPGKSGLYAKLNTKLSENNNKNSN